MPLPRQSYHIQYGYKESHKYLAVQQEKIIRPIHIILTYKHYLNS